MSCWAVMLLWIRRGGRICSRLTPTLPCSRIPRRRGKCCQRWSRIPWRLCKGSFRQRIRSIMHRIVGSTGMTCCIVKKMDTTLISKIRENTRFNLRIPSCMRLMEYWSKLVNRYAEKYQKINNAHE